MDDKVKKNRSPQFPFIPLQKAVERARVFEAEYHNHQARAVNAAKLWGYAEKSSGGIQTIAALCAYGLMDDEGMLEARKLRLTPLAMTILKDARPGAAKAALKTAALKPKALAELYAEWDEFRPPDAECISTLVIDRAFTDEAARRFLAIYDANLSYTDMAASDKIGASEEEEKEPETPLIEDKQPVLRNLPPASKVQTMAGERVVFAHELKPDQGFRVIVSGPVDAAMLEAIEAYAKFQKALLKVPSAAKSADDKPTH